MGWHADIFDESRDCREDIAALRAVCGEYYMQCLTFIDVLRDRGGVDEDAEMAGQHWTAKGNLVLTARETVLTDEEDQAIFTSLLRADISAALEIAMDFVAILRVSEGLNVRGANLADGDAFVEVKYVLTSDVSEIRVLRLIESLRLQALDPGSRLRGGEVTNTVAEAGEMDYELELNQCPMCPHCPLVCAARSNWATRMDVFQVRLCSLGRTLALSMCSNGTRPTVTACSTSKSSCKVANAKAPTPLPSS